jgi:hypothetical protein
MSSINVTNIKHPSSASNNIVLDSSGNVVLQAGTASAPALQPTSDPNTGIFFPAADTIAFAEGGSEAMRIDSSSRLLVGTSTSRAVGTIQASIQAEGAGMLPSSLNLTNTANDTTGPSLRFGKVRSTSVVQNGDTLGSIAFCGHDGTDLDTPGAYVLAEVDGTPGSNDLPSRLVFSTTADGASSPTERMRIPQNGYTRFSNTGVYTNISSTAHGFRSDGGDWILDNVNANASPYGMIIRYSAASPNGTGNEAFLFSDSTTTRFSVRSNGGITNFSGNNVNLSDINSKKDIAPAAGTWDCLKEWEIVNFRYKDQPDDADLNLGVIAQQVAQSCPEVITVFQEAKEATEDHPAQEERLGVKEQQMMWMSIKALQEAQLRIEALEAEVAALKAS